MEKNIFRVTAVFLLLNLTSFLFSQNIDLSSNIRINVWAELDACPELAEAQDTSSGQFDYTIKRIRQSSLFLLNGMTNGWNFSYTPSDKLRGVDEIFQFSEILPFGENEKMVSYKKPWVQDNTIHCWVEFPRTAQMKRSYAKWNSIKNPQVKGRGKAPVNKGFDGITTAAKEALKDAVRNHYRKILKNKPKEIRGSVLIKKEPGIGIDAGHYIVELDFFLETDRIILYKEF